MKITVRELKSAIGQAIREARSSQVPLSHAMLDQAIDSLTDLWLDAYNESDEIQALVGNDFNSWSDAVAAAEHDIRSDIQSCVDRIHEKLMSGKYL